MSKKKRQNRNPQHPTQLGAGQDQFAKKTQEPAQREESVAERERLVSERERLVAPDVIERNRAVVEDLDRRETQLHKLEREFDERVGAIVKREQDAAVREGQIVEQLRQLSTRELNATSGFLEQNRTSLAALERQRDDLLGEMGRLNAEITELRQSRRQIEVANARLADEARDRVESDSARIRSERLQRLETQIRDEREVRQRELTETLRREREDAVRLLGEARETVEAEIARQRRDLELRRQELDEQQRQLDEGITELERREARHGIEQGVLEERQRLLDETIEERVCEAVEESERKCLQRDRKIEEQRNQIEEYWGRLQGFEDLSSRLGGEPEELLRRLRDREEEITRLRQELAERPGLELKDEVRTLREEQRKWSADRENLMQELLALRAKRDSWVMGASEQENAQRLREVAERHVETMEAQVHKLQVDVNRLRSLYEQPQEVQARVGVIEQPYFQRTEQAAEPSSEQAWLEQIRVGCETSGLIFPQRLLWAFHTALKTAEWSPLAVLAGVSGTGKSELPRLFARFGGLNYLPLSVQPNWDSPQSLFGFFNSVDNRFNATPLLQSLTQSQRSAQNDSGLEDQILLVLLDEMNLAHVELYFSDLLSKLELRRGTKEGVQVEIDLGAGLKKYAVPLGPNVLWAGTMNEDETTKTLSDKVLDRGNFIVFPRPREFRRRAQAALADPAPMLPRSVWDSWVRFRSSFTDEQVQPYKQILEQMNAFLEHAGRALGHRVWQSVEYYLANHPDVIAAQASGGTEELSRAMLAAFEDQLVQKVMPKLRGIETSGAAKRDCLDPIQGLLKQSGIRLLVDFDMACAAGYGGFVWRSAHYLEEKS